MMKELGNAVAGWALDMARKALAFDSRKALGIVSNVVKSETVTAGVWSDIGETGLAALVGKVAPPPAYRGPDPARQHGKARKVKAPRACIANNGRESAFDHAAEAHKAVHALVVRDFTGRFPVYGTVGYR